MHLSWTWLCLASLFMLCAVALLIVRLPLRRKAFATFVAIALLGIVIPLVALGLDAYPPDGDPLLSAGVLMVLILIFASVGSWANYRRSQHAREMLRRGHADALPQWMQTIYRYLYDVKD